MAELSEKDVRLNREIINEILEKHHVDPAYASIRQMVAVVGEAETRLSTRFLRMEMGVPGLDPHPMAIEGEIGALRNARIPASYAPIGGVPALKEEAAKFFKLFMDIEIPSQWVLPTVGSMQGGFLSQAVAGRRFPEKDTILFVDPCFSVHRMQTRFLGLKDDSVDLYDRSGWLDRVEEKCAQGKIGAILYSTPNNPTWMILTEDEIRRLGEICTKYDVVAIEDIAYFAMDDRRDYSIPGEPPYPPTIAKYTDNYVILLSASKIFSYAGQRAAIAAISPTLAQREFEGLVSHFRFKSFGEAFLLSALYCTTSSVPQSPQYGLLTLLRKVNKGEFNFVKNVKEYATRANHLRKVMKDQGFQLVYQEDLGEPLADGFYFTFSYPGMTGGELVKELLYYGISSTTLLITHSTREEGVRACVSMIGKEDFSAFETRIKAFRQDHPVQGEAVEVAAEPNPEEKAEDPEVVEPEATDADTSSTETSV